MSNSIKASIESNVTVKDIHQAINAMGQYGCILVPEFTFYDQRIDAILIKPEKTRRIMGFEIKVSRADFIQDAKWQNYSRFCSSLSLACPSGLIKPEEIPSPFGLLWVEKKVDVRNWDKKECVSYPYTWAKRPKDFQGNKGLAWTWTYLEVIELEFKRLAHEERMRHD